MFYEVKPLVLILIGAAVVMSQTALAIPFAVLLIVLGAFIMGMRFIVSAHLTASGTALGKR